MAEPGTETVLVIHNGYEHEFTNVTINNLVVAMGTLGGATCIISRPTAPPKIKVSSEPLPVAPAVPVLAPTMHTPVAKIAVAPAAAVLSPKII